MITQPAPLPLPHLPNPVLQLPRELLTEEEVPLGWECANPALQIERWGLEGGVASPEAR
jgi:hypothetical protein